ncbi:acetylglutamate kinase [Minwuia thermotolerans]|uniref:Acetylglutamate kinase n=1 Tax=Minwuia thermotolerans TaxID=2056226 RepID=A0A2M9G6R6_9PROT|nr:acetylglutamate kinase [Minwuia thermotolerans]
MTNRAGRTGTLNEELLRKAATLQEALPYLRRFAGEVFVIKYGGHAMGDDTLAKAFAENIVLLKQVGIHPVIVHGGGPQIGRMLERLKIHSQFVDGLRVTDRETVDIVEMVLSGSINKQIVSAIQLAGGMAIGLSGKDGALIQARKLTRSKADPDSNIERILDLGFVGEPRHINPDIFNAIDLDAVIPVIAPIGVGKNGETFNINADSAAGAIASALGAAKLIMLTDVAGVLDKDGQLLPVLTPRDVLVLRGEGVITGGMIPKIETCLDAVRNGVGAATILDGRVENVILLETFTEHGVGTMIRRDDPADGEGG